jgi:phosphohistidine phosphatase SixA
MAALSVVPTPATAAELAGKALVDALRQGGYVLVLRHANSPNTPPDRASADSENVALERQLDAAGRDSALAMGKALRTLGLPLGDILSSPTYRARETVRLAGFGAPKIFNELDESAQGMAANVEKARADFLRQKVTERPAAGKDTVVVTHAPNIIGAFGKEAEGVAAGETLVFRPGTNGAILVARVKIEDWSKLGAGG